MGRVAWGKAKREILALKADISAFLSSGATLEETFQTLKGQGRITVGKSTFFRHAASIRDEAREKPEKPEPVIITPEVLAWFAAVPRQTSPTQLPPTTSRAVAPIVPATSPEAARAAAPSSTPSDRPASPAAAPQRQPIGAGAEPRLRKYQHFKSGEKNHWDAEQPVHNQGDDRK